MSILRLGKGTNFSSVSFDSTDLIVHDYMASAGAGGSFRGPAGIFLYHLLFMLPISCCNLSTHKCEICNACKKSSAVNCVRDGDRLRSCIQSTIRIINDGHSKVRSHLCYFFFSCISDILKLSLISSLRDKCLCLNSVLIIFDVSDTSEDALTSQVLILIKLLKLTLFMQNICTVM